MQRDLHPNPIHWANRNRRSTALIGIELRMTPFAMPSIFWVKCSVTLVCAEQEIRSAHGVPLRYMSTNYVCLLYKKNPSVMSQTSAHNIGVFMCFVWISEQTAVIAVYSIDSLVFVTETLCLLCGTD